LADRREKNEEEIRSQHFGKGVPPPMVKCLRKIKYLFLSGCNNLGFYRCNSISYSEEFSCIESTYIVAVVYRSSNSEASTS
jgi:hypothetical protein